MEQGYDRHRHLALPQVYLKGAVHNEYATIWYQLRVLYDGRRNKAATTRLYEEQLIAADN